MKLQKLIRISFSCVVFGYTASVFLPNYNILAYKVFAQSGNSVSGYVFGLERQPINDVNVELLDDYSRAVQRTKTNGSGRYYFSGFPPGRYRVRVMPYGTEYLEQEQEFEIVNLTRESQSGGLRISGFSNEQRDFHLRLRKGVVPRAAEVVFVQSDIPAEAKAMYERAIKAFDDKKHKEALESLKSSLEIFPKYYVALERLGTEYISLGHFDAAQILLGIAVDVNPRGYKSWYGLGYSLYSLKRIDEAAVAIQKAIEVNPNSAEATLLSGVLMRQRKRYDDAEKQFFKAKELSNNAMPLVHWHLALLYGNDLKRYGDAAKQLKLYLKVQPNIKDAETIKKLIKDFEAKAQQK
jgi:tetratricopeptide (TPR) repeat protein